MMMPVISDGIRDWYGWYAPRPGVSSCMAEPSHAAHAASGRSRAPVVHWYARSSQSPAPPFSVHGHGRDDRNAPGLVHRPHGSGDYLIVQFLTSVTVYWDDRLRACPPQSLFVFTPGHRQTYGLVGAHWSHSWLHCHGAAVDRAVAASRVPCLQPIPIEDPLFADRHVAGIEAELRDHDQPDAEILECLMRIWVRAINRAAAPRPAHRVIPPRVMAVRNRLEAQLERPAALAGLAREAGLSVSRFSDTFRHHFGISPIRYLLRLRLQRATHLLRDRNLSIATVARAVGFEDAFFFSRQFRKEHGCSPLTWRRRLSGSEGP
jgi:AraC family transcriptional regulator of arabinose operon